MSGPLLAIDAAMVVIAAWIAIGLAGVAAIRSFRVVAFVLFPASAALSIALAAVGLAALPAAPEVAILAIGLPDLPFHLRLDPLSAFVLVILGLASAGISVFAGGYFREGEGAAGCASGSQMCSGRMPALAPKPKRASRNAAEAHSGGSRWARMLANV